ncbi:MAG TPA: acyltransferase [Xanthobacteraceae bacterium]|jgi:peptidoglycan/LPS O-acetylase OafA/YrhL|nr:acyltransferase [Xanthobacteraceae bacterium]
MALGSTAALGQPIHIEKAPAVRAEVSRNFGLDVVRAAAILSVLVAHFTDVTAILTGTRAPIFIAHLGNGVELFFALSGFLIGGLLMDIAEPGLRAWAIFMTRRWMRTVPLYVVWLVTLLIVWRPQHDLAEHAIKYLTFSQDLLWRMPPDNWFGVSWSLAVEEWFYLLFAATLLGLSTIFGRWAIALATGAFILVPLALRTALVTPDLLANWDEALRKVVIYRLDAIAYGVAVAGFVRYWPNAVRQLSVPLLFAGIMIVIAVTATARPLYMIALYPAGLALCLPAATLIPRPHSIIAEPIRWLSTRSYALYIVHLSLLEFSAAAVTTGLMNPWSTPLVAGLGMVALSELSFRFLESPILRKRPRQFGLANLVANCVASSADTRGAYTC